MSGRDIVDYSEVNITKTSPWSAGSGVIFHIRKQELPAWEFRKSCADLIAESFVTVIGVFEQNQTAVIRKAAFSGEVESYLVYRA